MKHNPLIQRKEMGEKILNFWLDTPCIHSAEILAYQNWHALTVDLQHGAIDYQTMLNIFSAASVADNANGKAAPILMARIATIHPATVNQALDAGALGIIAPLIRSAEDVRSLVNYCYYPPAGERSYAGVRAGRLLNHISGEQYLQVADDMVMPIAMIETREAYDNLQEIMEVDGLRGIYIGPSDLSIAFGHLPANVTENQAMVGHICNVIEQALSEDMLVGIHTANATESQFWIDQGADLVTAGSTLASMSKASLDTLSTLKNYQ